MRRHDEFLDHLAHVPMFSACSKKELSLVARLGAVRQVDAGEQLTTQGRPGSELFVVIGGKADVDRGGTSIATLGPGDFFGELALFDARGVRNATVIATTPMSVLVVSRHDFDRLLEEAPSLTRKLLTGMARRIQELDDRI